MRQGGVIAFLLLLATCLQQWANLIDDMGVETIAMHYGIVWGKTKSIPIRFPINLVGIRFVFPPIQYHNALQ